MTKNTLFKIPGWPSPCSPGRGQADDLPEQQVGSPHCSTFYKTLIWVFSFAVFVMILLMELPQIGLLHTCTFLDKCFLWLTSFAGAAARKLLDCAQLDQILQKGFLLQWGNFCNSSKSKNCSLKFQTKDLLAAIYFFPSAAFWCLR